MKRFNTGYWLSAATASVLMAAVAHAATWDQKIAEGAHQILIGDFNGDQHSDVLWQAKRPEDEHTAIFTAVTSANTQRWKDGHLSKVWSRKDVNVIVGDFNGDLNSDILLQSITPALTSELIITESSGHIGVPTQSIGDWHLGLRWDSNNSRAIVGDFNGDGRDDLFLHGKDKNRHGLALANEDGQFQKLEFDFDNYLHNLDWSDKNTTLSTGDFNGDGKYELLLQPIQSDGLVSTVGGDYQQGPLATITQQWSAQHLGFDWSSRRHRVVVGDFDGNGKDDVFLLGTTKIDASAYLTASENQFDTVKERIETIPNLDKLKDIIVADFDADGIDELLLMFDDKQHPLMLLLADGARRARLEALFRLNGLLNGKQTLGWLTGVVASTPITPSKSLANAAAVPQCGPTDVDCEDPDTGTGGTNTDPYPIVSDSAYKSFQEFGIVNGAFRVDENGAATYSYPIATLPGSGNVAPKMGLIYSSRAGNGPVGIGWSISGLSSITRCRATKETDGADGSDFSFFCFDGQRLLSKGGTGSATDPWRFVTEIDNHARISAFGASIKNPDYFTVERKDGSTSYFGNSASSKLEVASVSTGNPIAGRINSWAIGRFKDKANNYIEYKYSETFGHLLISEVQYTGNSSQLPYASLVFEYEDRPDVRTTYALDGIIKSDKRLKAIRSKDGINGSGAEIRRYELSYAPVGRSPLSRLEFIQECVISTCLPAVQFKWNIGVNRIESTWRDNAGEGFTHRFVSAKQGDFNGDGKLDLGYIVRDSKEDNANDFWFTNGITKIDGDKVYFDLNHSVKIKLPHGDPNSWQLLDYNGDGRTDLLTPLCVANSTSWESNGEALKCTEYRNWGVLLARADGSFPTGTLTSPYVAEKIDTGIPLKNSQTVGFGDFDGNGLPDLLFRDEYSRATISFLGHPKLGHVCESHDSARTYCFSKPRLLAGLSGLDWLFLSDKQPVIADVNGDGFSDLIVNVTYGSTLPGGGSLGDPGITRKRAVLFSVDSYFGIQYRVSEVATDIFDSLSIDKDKLSQFADMNGDGLTDILKAVVNASTGRYEWSISSNTGTTFLPWKSTGVSTPDDVLRLVDLNNDGLSDFLYPQVAGADSTTFQVRFQNGDGTFASPVNSGWTARNDHYATNLFSDFNGDGAIDAALLFHRDKDGYVNSNHHISLSEDKNLARNTIKEIVTGVGNKTLIEYKSLNSDVYSIGRTMVDAVWGKKSPVFDVRGPMYVVSSVRSSAPTATGAPFGVDKDRLVEIKYHYEGLKMQAGGRGILGFEKVYTFDPQTNVETTTTYRQDFPFTGMPLRTDKVLLSGFGSSFERFGMRHDSPANWLSISGYDGFSTMATAQSGTMAYFSTSTDTVREPNTGVVTSKTLTTTVYDAWGNVDLVTVEQQNGYPQTLRTVVTDNVFPDGEDGFLGRLASSTVTTKRSGFVDSIKKSSFEYHPTNKQLTAEIVEPEGNEKEYLRTEYGLDNWGNRTSTTVKSKDSVGSTSPYYINRTSRVEYDSKGRFIDKKYNHFGQLIEEVLERNAFYAPSKVKGLNGIILTTEFTAMGRISAQYDNSGLNGAQGSRKDIFLEQCGSNGLTCPSTWHAYRIRTVNNSGPDSEQYFDVLGRESLSLVEAMEGSDGDKIAKATEYDNLSRVKRVSLPYFDNSTPAGWTRNDYDAIGRLWQVMNPDGSSTTTTYSGLTTIFVNEKGQKKVEIRNELGELVTVTDNNNKSITYSYDIGGRLDKMTRVGLSDKFQSDLDYDRLGRKIKMWDADKSPIADSFWMYDYNAVGEIVKQTDPRGYVTLNTYDGAGRLVRRLEKNADTATAIIFADTSWTFDNLTSAGGSNNSRSQLIAESDLISGYNRVPTYDNFGRVTSVATSFESNRWTESTGFDEFGRTSWSRDASGQAVKLKYTPRGFVKEKYDLANSAIVYQIIEKMDQFGHIVLEKAGSGAITTIRRYFPKTGRLDNILTTGNGQTLQNLNFGWDLVGNLTSRQDYSSGRNLTETFDYDGLNRLITQNGLEYARYDDEGNITHKKDVTNFVSGQEYQYGGSCGGIQAGPHALTAVEGQTYCYDRNGNQLSGKGRTLIYDNTYDLPTQIRTNKHTTDFVYGPSHQRLKRVDNNTTTGRATTYYVGNVEIIVKGGKTEYRRNLGNAVVNNGVVSYLLTDHLGSTHRVVNCNGGILQNISFDAFGDKRNSETWSKLFVDFNAVASMPRTTEWLISPLSNSRTLHGYTGHEQMDEVGLIHMNGRVYDAHLGRFLQADPIIQAPTNSQSLNRYSYIINNPLSGVDPSGFSWWQTHRSEWKGALAVVVTVLSFWYCGTVCGNSIWATMAVGAATAIFSHIVMTGSTHGAFKAGLIGAVSAGVFYGIGSAFSESACSTCYETVDNVKQLKTTAMIAKTIAHAYAGGAMSALQGGKFGHGFLSAGVTQAFSKSINGIDEGARFSLRRIVAAAVIGGTVSELTGGKFANGAITAAYSRAFNDEVESHGLDTRRSREPYKQLTKTTVTVDVDESIAGYGVSQGYEYDIDTKKWSGPSVSLKLDALTIGDGDVSYGVGLGPVAASIGVNGEGPYVTLGGGVSTAAGGVTISQKLQFLIDSISSNFDKLFNDWYWSNGRYTNDMLEASSGTGAH